MTFTTSPPYKFYTDLEGTALEAGKLYVGVAGLDAQANPVTAYWDSDLTIVASQPIRTISGVPDNSGTPADFFTELNYSITVNDSDDTLVYSKLQVNSGEILPTFPQLQAADWYFTGIVNFGAATINTTGDALAGTMEPSTTASNAKGETAFATIKDIRELCYPIGSLYVSLSDSDPATTLGFGTWVAESEGRAVVGVGTADGKDYTPGLERGSNFETLTIEKSIGGIDFDTFGAYGGGYQTRSIPTTTAYSDYALTGNASAGTGSGIRMRYNASISPHNNTQPSMGFYIWRRTA